MVIDAHKVIGELLVPLKLTVKDVNQFPVVPRSRITTAVRLFSGITATAD